MIEADDAGIRKEGDVLHTHGPELPDNKRHEPMPQTHALIGGVDDHIPHRGVDHPISDATGKAHQPREKGVVTPDPHHQQAVAKGPPHPPHWALTPTDRRGDPLQFQQVHLPRQTEKQPQLGVGDLQLLKADTIETVQQVVLVNLVLASADLGSIDLPGLAQRG